MDIYIWIYIYIYMDIYIYMIYVYIHVYITHTYIHIYIYMCITHRNAYTYSYIYTLIYIIYRFIKKNMAFLEFMKILLGGGWPCTHHLRISITGMSQQRSNQWSFFKLNSGGCWHSNTGVTVPAGTGTTPLWAPNKTATNSAVTNQSRALYLAYCGLL